MFKAVDAFCGAGGLSLGLMKADFEVIYSFDNDKNCIELIENGADFLAVISYVWQHPSGAEVAIKKLHQQL